jgi:hypothetical protein
LPRRKRPLWLALFWPGHGARAVSTRHAQSQTADTIRVFVFGESAAYGDPQPEFGLCRVLEALLDGRYPDKHFEVINTAMTAINSHVILPIARDCAAQNGDFWVIYMGNNEVVGPYGSGTVFGPQAANLALVRAGVAFKATRIGQALGNLVRHAQKRPLNQSEWGGMACSCTTMSARTTPAWPRFMPASSKI